MFLEQISDRWNHILYLLSVFSLTICLFLWPVRIIKQGIQCGLSSTASLPTPLMTFVFAWSSPWKCGPRSEATSTRFYRHSLLKRCAQRHMKDYTTLRTVASCSSSFMCEFRVTQPEFCEKSQNKYINILTYREKFHHGNFCPATSKQLPLRVRICCNANKCTIL